MAEKSTSAVTGPVDNTGIRAVAQTYHGAIFLVLGVLTSGCGPAVVEQAPRGWPEKWRGRQLYATPGVLVYAGTEASAGEIDRLVRSVSADIEKETNTCPERGLLIVVDKGEEPVFSDLDALVKLGAAGEGDPNADATLDGEEFMKAQEKMKETGLDLGVIMSLEPVRLNFQLLTEYLHLPRERAETVVWAAVLPTKACVRVGLKQTLDAALKQEEVDAGKRLILAGLMPLLEGKMVNEAAAKREVVLYECMMESLPEEMVPNREELIKTYRQEKIGRQEK